MSTEQTPAADPRVLLAAERTLLAWIRTALALMGFGFVVARFGLFLRELTAAHDLAPPAGRGVSLWVGVGLVALGLVVLVGSGERYRRYASALAAGYKPQPPGAAFAVAMTGLLILAGVGMAIYLLSAA